MSASAPRVGCRTRPAAGAFHEDATVVALVPLVLVTTLLLAIVLVELGGQLVARSRAAALADAAALAAVAVEAEHGPDVRRPGGGAAGGPGDRAVPRPDAGAVSERRGGLAPRSADRAARPVSPRQAAERVARAGGGRLETCRCPPGADRAAVSVSVEVGGLVRPRLGASRQLAHARAVLTP